MTDLWTEDDREIVESSCAQCGRDFRTVTGFIHDHNGPLSIYKAAFHFHDGQHETRIDVLLGSFDAPEDSPADRVTFGCRIGPLPGHDTPQVSLVEAARAFSGPVFGRKLTRDEALAHAWLKDFWRVVDHIVINDPEVAAHID